MDQDGEAAPVDGLPDGGESGVGEGLAVDVGQGDHPDEAESVAGAVEFGDGVGAVLPGEARQAPETVGMGAADVGDVVVGQAGGEVARVAVAPEGVGCGQGEDRQVDAARVHRGEPGGDVEHAGGEGHEGCAEAVDGGAARAVHLDLVLRPAARREQVEVGLAEDVGVHVDDGHCSLPGYDAALRGR